MFTGTPLQGAMPIDGTLDYGVDVPLLGTGGGVGIGGTVMGIGVVEFTAFFRPFFAGMQTVMTTYSYHVPAGGAASHVVTNVGYSIRSFTGTDSRTPGGLGQVTLVSPILVRFEDGACISCYYAPIAVGLTVSFVPEPGTLALLGAGTLGLCAYGRRRQRRAQSLTPPRVDLVG